MELTPLKSEPLLRLLLADLVGESTTRQSLLTLREDIADVLERLEESEASAAALPHRSKYLLMVTPSSGATSTSIASSSTRSSASSRPRIRRGARRGLSRPGDRPGR